VNQDDDDFELDPDLDSALDAWAHDFEQQAKAESAPMPQASAKSAPPPPKPAAPAKPSEGRSRPLYQPDPELLRGREAPRRPAAPAAPPVAPAPQERFPSFVDDDDDSEESTKIASIPKELIASLQEVAAAREAKERADAAKRKPAEPKPASARPPRSPVPGIDLDLDDLFEGLDKETRISDLPAQTARIEPAASAPTPVPPKPASERPPTPDEVAAAQSIESLETDFLDPFADSTPVPTDAAPAPKQATPEAPPKPLPPRPLPPTPKAIPPRPPLAKGLPPRPAVPPLKSPPAWKPPAPPPGLGRPSADDVSTLERPLDSEARPLEPATSSAAASSAATSSAATSSAADAATTAASPSPSADAPARARESDFPFPELDLGEPIDPGAARAEAAERAFFDASDEPELAFDEPSDPVGPPDDLDDLLASSPPAPAVDDDEPDLAFDEPTNVPTSLRGSADDEPELAFDAPSRASEDEPELASPSRASAAADDDEPELAFDDPPDEPAPSRASAADDDEPDLAFDDPPDEPAPRRSSAADDDEPELAFDDPPDEPAPRSAAAAAEVSRGRPSADDDEPELAFDENAEDDREVPAFGGDSGLTELAPPTSEAPPPANEPTADHGAATAQRTVRQRKPRAERFAFVGRDAETQRRRADLLHELAERTNGSARARLLTAAAELHERLGAPDAAREAYLAAHEADREDVLVLRALRRDALRRRDFGEAADLLAAEAALPLGATDRAHALTLLAELQLVHLADPSAAERSASAAHALHATPASALLRLEARQALGDSEGTLDATRDARAAWSEPSARAALDATLALAAERAGRRDEAVALHRAIASSPLRASGALGVARLAEPNARAEALVALADALSAPSIAEAFRRVAASTRLPFDAAAARDVLNGVSRPASLRARARAARLAGDRETRATTLEALAAATGGTERALALVELAETRAELGDLEAASAALRDAAVADERLDTIRVVREILSRRADDPTRLAPNASDGPSEDDTSAIALAARVARGEDRDRERALLDSARERGESPLASELALLDAAAERGDRNAIVVGLRRHADRLPPERRVGALLALARFLEGEERLAVLRTAADAAPTPVVLRALARELRGAERARTWELEAEASAGEPAFHAWIQAGRAHVEPTDARRAFERAFDEQPGPSAAAWALERDPAVDVATLAERLLDVASGARPAALAAASAAVARDDAPSLVRALEHAERSAAPDPALDAWIAGHVAVDAATVATLSEARASTCQSPAEKRLHLLRAAIAHEHAGDPRAAAVALRAVRELVPDPLAASALDRVELAAGEHARVADRRFEAVREASTPAERLPALEALASLDLHDRGDTSSAVLTLRSILEDAPGHLPTLRALAHHAMAQGDDEGLESVARALALHLPIDRLASPELVAHARGAARLALARAEVPGDAADGLLREVGARVEHVTDDWLLRHLASSAADDAGRARWKSHRAELARGDAMERSAELLDAAEAVAIAEGPGAAALLLAPTAQLRPDDPITADRRGIWLRAAGEHHDAGVALSVAARTVGDPIHAVRLHYEAGRAFEDAGDAAAASDAYERAADLDVRYHDLFDRARRLLEAAGEPARLARLVAKRVDAGADTRTLVELHENRAQLALGLGDRAGARDALKAALALDPQRVDALRRLARLQLEDADWRGAAESLIRIARLRQDRDELRWVFFTLGDIYDRHLPEPKRAEAAFRRVLKLLPDDLEALDRLASLFERENQYADAVPVVEELLAKEIDPDERHRHLLRLAIAHERRGDPRSAEHVLDDARKKAPTDLVVLRAMVDLYERQRAPAALAMHLGRAAGDFRRLVEEDATSVDAWSGLVEVLDWKDRRDAARAVASVATALGVHDVGLGSRLDSLGGIPGAGTAAADADLRDAIAPRMLNRTVFEVFRLGGEAFDKALPFDAKAWRAEKLPARGPSLRDEAMRVARIFGISDVQVLVTSAAPRLCVAVGDRPATILVGHDLAASTTEAERAVLFTRALGIIHAGLAVVMRSQPEAVLLLVGGLLKSIDPMYAHAQLDPRALDDMAKRIGKNIPRKNRDALVPLAIEMGGAPGFDPSRLGLHAAELGDRLALLALGATPSTLSALLALANTRLPEAAGAAERVAATKKVPEAWSLVRFAISDAHFDARHRAGADRP
jgi:tetratricopeptide (TPR) repeat protein